MIVDRPRPGNGPDDGDDDPIAVKYRSLGGPRSILGIPVGPEQTLPDGGLSRTYQHGVIYWSSATGAWEVHGPILDKWSALRREAGFLGYPRTDVTDVGDHRGVFTSFQDGVIYWTEQTAAR